MSQAQHELPMVLSIQSHVAFGHVGNSAAVFPLQRMGIAVVDINTVQFSNHTGYGEFRGQVFPASHIEEVLEGLQARGVLDRIDAVLSGYQGDAGSGEIILQAVERVRRSNANALYLCDPVMGDVGRGMFVRPGIPEFLKRRAVPNANIITPNQFEFEYLAGRSLSSTQDAVAAARALMTDNPLLQMVVITSLVTPDVAPERLRTLAVARDSAWFVEAPRIELSPLPNGMGDTFSAVLLGDYLKHADMPQALLHATGTLTELLEQTASGSRDLPLVAGQALLGAPRKSYQLQAIDID